MRKMAAVLLTGASFFFVAAGALLLQIWTAGHADGANAHEAGLRITVVDSSFKVCPKCHLEPDTEPFVRLAAARNEEESGQFILFSPQKISSLTAVMSDLRNPKGSLIPAAAISLLLAQPVIVAERSDALGKAGSWPDALVPIAAPIELKGSQSQGVWIRVKVDANTEPGLYTGAVTIGAGGKNISRIGVELEVWNVTLPKTAVLPALVGLDYEMIARFEGVPDSSPAFETEVLPRYYQALGRNHVYPLFVHGAQPGYRDNGERAVLDMAPFWKRVDAALGEARSTAPIGVPYSESWPINTTVFPLMSREYRRRAHNYLKAIAAELDARGALDRSFIYLQFTDEPKSAAQIARIREFAELVRQANPRLRMLQTVHAYCDDCSGSGQAGLEHPSLLWAPNVAYYDGKALRLTSGLFPKAIAMPSGWTPETSKRLKQKRRPVWWYFNAWTFLLDKPPAYPTLFIDHPGIEHRAVGWLAFHYGIAGLGYWNATYWRSVDNPWKTMPRGEGGAGTAGDGMLLYPAAESNAYTGQPKPDGPISSVRLELLREGIEDHALIEQLRMRPGGAELAASMVDGLVRSLSDFERDPAKYHDARRRIAQAIARLQATSLRGNN